MMATCKWCGLIIPLYRRMSAKYCSNECYYDAKMERLNNRYYELSRGHNIRIKNERILMQFDQLTQKGIKVTYEMFDACGFDWGFANGEVADKENNIWKIIGNYYYYLQPDKTIIIWKQETSGQ